MKRQKRQIGVVAVLLALSVTVIGYTNNGQSVAAPAAPAAPAGPPNQAPIADLVLNPPEGSAPLTVVADGSGSSDDKAVTSYGFSWGDGTRSKPEPVSTASHVYQAPGTYTVRISVRDADKRQATAQKTIVVNAAAKGPDMPPVAEVTALASGPGDVVIDAGASADDRRIAGYQFDFGDGSRTVKQPASTVRHHYKRSGTYTMRVTVTDTAGATDTATTTLAVTAAAEPTGPTQPTVVSFTFDDTFANQIQAADVLKSRGMKGTFYINSPRVGSSSTYMSRAQVDALKTWHEVAGHTLTHVDLTTVSTTEATRQICDDRTATGGNLASFAYPFGATSTTVKNITRNCGYATARGVGNLRSPGYGCLSCATAETIPAADPYQISTNKSVQSDTTVEMLKTYVTQAENDRGGWVPLVFHSICSGCATNSIDIGSFTAFVDWMATRPASTQVKTMASVTGTTPTPTPTVTSSPSPTPTATTTPTPTTTPTTAPRSVTIGTQTRTINGNNVARLTNYLVRYTPTYGARTRTNQFGYEAEVIGGRVTKVANGVGNMAIPANGYVLSGHGTSRTWLTTHARVGATVVLNY